MVKHYLALGIIIPVARTWAYLSFWFTEGAFQTLDYLSYEQRVLFWLVERCPWVVKVEE